MRGQACVYHEHVPVTGLLKNNVIGNNRYVNAAAGGLINTEVLKILPWACERGNPPEKHHRGHLLR